MHLEPLFNACSAALEELNRLRIQHTDIALELEEIIQDLGAAVQQARKGEFDGS